MRILLLFCLSSFLVSASAQGFSFIDIQGKPQRLIDYRGKWLVVNFWSTRCSLCEQETPELVALQDAHKNKDLSVISIALETNSNSATLANFAARNKINYPIIATTFTRMEEQLPYPEALPETVKDLPATLIFNPAGELATFQKGITTSEDVEAYLLVANNKKK